MIRLLSFTLALGLLLPAGALAGDRAARHGYDEWARHGRPAALPDGLVVSREPLASGDPALSIVTLSVRPGTTVPVLYMKQRRPYASVVLFVGGFGRMNLSPTEFPGTPINFVLRSRGLFFDRNFTVAVIDAPSDAEILSGDPTRDFYRFTPEHALDVGGLVRFLRSESRAPVWLVGTSAGTRSIASVSAQLHGHEAPDGIVLTSTVLQGSRSVFNADLASIGQPTLLLHHVQDACFLTLFEDIPSLVNALTGVRKLEVVGMDGGGPPHADVCGPWGFHGFPGLEGQVVDEIAAFILTHRGEGQHR